MNNITMTIELCAEDRARLDKILAALEKQKDCKGCVETVSKATEHIVEIMTEEPPKNEPQATPEEEVNKQPTEPEKVAPVEEEPATEEELVTASVLQKKVVDLCAKGLKDKVREIVNTYAVRVSDIPEDKRAECFEKLIALEG